MKYHFNGNYENTVSNGDARVKISELKKYYDNSVKTKEYEWKKKLGEDLDWYLSFDNLREKDTTKHVHRLHSYKGKFIPQLVEYFLDNHIDEFKKEVYFNPGDTVLDPFMGSGTTLVQSSEMGINSIGIDISKFNCLIAEVKILYYNIEDMEIILNKTAAKTKKFSEERFNDRYAQNLKNLISNFNKNNFLSPDYKININKNLIDEKEYSEIKLKEFYDIFSEFKQKNKQTQQTLLSDEEIKEIPNFISDWYTPRIREELFFYLNLINEIEDERMQNLMKVVLSRTARSCRATTHSDLATLIKPIYDPYYCKKHYKICTPINTIKTKLNTYTIDTIKRIKEFSKLRKNVFTQVIHSDSKNIDILKNIKSSNPKFYEIIKKHKIDGIFSSPPYVGQIDYHEQHAYAYELFDIERRDENEIGPMFKGKSKKAKDDYIEGISLVLSNMKQFLKDNSNIFIVANDKFNLYPIIAEKSGLKIVNEYKRPVLNRTERDKQPYSEKIFHMMKK